RALEREPAGIEPGLAGLVIEGAHHVVEAEVDVGKAEVIRCARGEPLEPAPEIVAPRAHHAAGEWRSLGFPPPLSAAPLPPPPHPLVVPRPLVPCERIGAEEGPARARTGERGMKEKGMG